MKKLVALLLILAMLFSLAACSNSSSDTDTAANNGDTSGDVTDDTNDANEAEDPGTDDGAAASEGNPNLADFVPYEDQSWDINEYYNTLGVESDVTYTATGGIVTVPDVPTTEMPKAKERFTVGFSIYYTVDEVGSMMLETAKEYAEICGVDLLVNDANYDQDAQNQAIEQWIVEGVDGVVLAPCDFYGVQGALDALNKANIPVVTINPALAGQADAVVMSECTEQGRMTGELLLNALKESGSDMKGTIVYQSLPFVHPNAATRSLGFKEVFEDYPDIEIVELTGNSPEEHYTAFEGAIMNYGDDLIGAFGLYSSATIGMLNAKKAAGSDVPITSIDNDKVILEGIYNGDLLGSVCYSSTSPAIWALSQLVNLLNGEEIPAIMFYPNTTVTQENVEEMFEFYYNGKTLSDYMAGLVD